MKVTNDHYGFSCIEWLQITGVKSDRKGTCIHCKETHTYYKGNESDCKATTNENAMTTRRMTATTKERSVTAMRKGATEELATSNWENDYKGVDDDCRIEPKDLGKWFSVKYHQFLKKFGR